MESIWTPKALYQVAQFAITIMPVLAPLRNILRDYLPLQKLTLYETTKF